MLGLLRKGHGRKRLKISRPLIGVVLLCFGVFSEVGRASKRGYGGDGPLPEVFVAGKLSKGYQVANQVFSDLDGKKVSLFDLKGKVLVVVFWAPWSLDSVTLLQAVQDAKRHFSARGLGDRIAFLPISDISIADLEAVKFARDSYGLELPMYVDDSHALFEYFDITSIPLTLIVDKEGAVVYRIAGYFRFDHPEILKVLMDICDKEQVSAGDLQLDDIQ